MLELKNFFDKIIQFVQLNESEDFSKTDFDSEIEGLYEEAETKANVDGFNGKGECEVELTDDELQAYQEWKEWKELKQDITTSLSSLYAKGQISEELSVQINEILSGSFDSSSLSDIEELLEAEGDENAEVNTLTNKEDIEEYFSSLSVSSKDAILEQIGGISEIDSIVVYENGVAKINTKEEGSAFTLFSSGKYIETFDDASKTGYSAYDEEGNVTNSLYVDHMRGDVVVQENTSYNEDGSSSKVIQNSLEPDIRQTVDMSCDKEITQIKTENVKTGDVTINYQKECPGSSMEEVSSNVSGIQGDINSANAELSSLQQEQQEVSADLSEQQGCLASTESQKESELGAIDSDITSGESDLSDANSNLSEANDNVCSSEQECQEAGAAVSESSRQADECNGNLSNACKEATESQGSANEAGDAKAVADDEANVAGNEKADADTKAADATTAADAANVEHVNAAGELAGAQDVESQAFSTLNQLNNKKAAAQREYEAAKAKQSVWQKIKSFVQSLANKVADLARQVTGAEKKAQDATDKREKAQTEEEKAAEALKERREEQKDAKELAEAAATVYELKTADAEVKSQEYADALLDLADALIRKDDAEDKYDNALQVLMDKKGWQADAEGNLLDAQGKQITCAEMCEQLETFVNDLYVTRETTSEAFDSTLSTIVDVINGDEVQLEEINGKITALQEEITAKEQELAMQEELMAQLEAEQASVEASKGSAGIVDDVFALFGGSYAGDEKAFEEQKAILLDAVINNDPVKLQEAYKNSHKDDEVIVDEDGNIINIDELDEAEVIALQEAMQTENGPKVVKLSDVSDEQVQKIYEAKKKEAAEAVNAVNVISTGVCVVNGHEVTLDDMKNALIAQAEDMQTDMTNAIERQGWLSSALSSANDLFGIGTSESEAQAQVDAYKNLINKLNACEDPVEFAALFKEVTGQNFNDAAILSLLAYNSAAGIEPAGKEVEVTENKLDLSESVNSCVNEVTEMGADKNAFSLTSGSNAAENIQEYIQTQTAITDGVIGVIDGVVVAASVAAAPFTGGASLALGAAVGAGTNLLLNSTNSVYDADGDGKNDFNYSLKEGVIDLGVGAVNGLVGTGANMAGAAITKGITSSANSVIATTFTQSAKRHAINVAGKMAGAAVDGALTGGASAGTNYIATVATNDNMKFSTEDFIKTTMQGAGAGAIFNTTLAGTTAIAGEAFGGLKASAFADDINKALSGEAGENALANMVAGKLDGDLLVDGAVNKYAVPQLMQNASNSLTALTKAGLTQEAALEFLDGASIQAQSTLPKVVNTVSDALKKSGANPDDIASIVKGMDLDNIVTDKAGNLLYARSYLADGTQITLDFGANGKLNAIGTTGANGTDGANGTNLGYEQKLKQAELGDSKAKIEIENAVKEGRDVNPADVRMLLDDEYERIREAGAYAVDYGDAAFSSDEEALMKAIGVDKIKQGELQADNGMIIYSESKHWIFRGAQGGDAVERMSANVLPEAEVISELDRFRMTGEYVNSAGELVKVDNITKFSYKTPQTLEAWNGRQDPLTFYFGSEVNDETYKAIAEITGKYARGTVANANSGANWVSNVEVNPTREMVETLSKELEQYSPSLAKDIINTFNSQRDRISSGQFEAFKNMLEYFKEAAAK